MLKATNIHYEMADRLQGVNCGGIGAHPKLVKIADELAQSAWRPMERLPKYEIHNEPRKKAFRYKEQIVIENESRNQKLVGEDITEIDYKPYKCNRKEVSSDYPAKEYQRETRREDCRISQRTMRPRERDRAVEEWSERDANARKGFGKQLGVYGNGDFGVESEVLVWTVDTQSRAGYGIGKNGISEISQCDHIDSLPNCKGGSSSHIPRFGIQ